MLNFMINMLQMPRLDVEKSAVFTGHKDCVYTLEVGTEGHSFFSAGGDGMVVLWNLQTPDMGTLVARMENSVYALHYLPAEQQLLIGQNFKGVHLIDVASKKELASAAITDSYIFDIKAVGPVALVATGDGTLIAIETQKLTTLAKHKISSASLRCIAVSPNGEHIAVGSSDAHIYILEANTGKIVHTIPAHTNSVFTLAYSPDGDYLLSGSRDAHLKIWNVASNYAAQQTIVAHMFAINHISYSPDENYFATCSMDKSIKIWDSKTFTLLKVIDKARHAGHGTSVNKLYWPIQKDRLVSCSDDRSISAWNIYST
jgi:WD40 repeat protein